MPDAERAQILAQLAALVGEGETPAELRVHVVIGLTALEVVA